MRAVREDVEQLSGHDRKTLSFRANGEYWHNAREPVAQPAFEKRKKVTCRGSHAYSWRIDAQGEPRARILALTSATWSSSRRVSAGDERTRNKRGWQLSQPLQKYTFTFPACTTNANVTDASPIRTAFFRGSRPCRHRFSRRRSRSRINDPLRWSSVEKPTATKQREDRSRTKYELRQGETKDLEKLVPS